MGLPEYSLILISEPSHAVTTDYEFWTNISNYQLQELTAPLMNQIVDLFQNLFRIERQAYQGISVVFDQLLCEKAEPLKIGEYKILINTKIKQVLNLSEDPTKLNGFVYCKVILFYFNY